MTIKKYIKKSLTDDFSDSEDQLQEDDENGERHFVPIRTRSIHLAPRTTESAKSRKPQRTALGDIAAAFESELLARFRRAVGGPGGEVAPRRQTEAH